MHSEQEGIGMVTQSLVAIRVLSPDAVPDIAFSYPLSWAWSRIRGRFLEISSYKGLNQRGAL